MDKGAIKTITLKRIVLEYTDGTLLVVPEKETFEIGTAFVSVLKEKNIEWHIMKKMDKNPLKLLMSFFKI